MSIEDGTLYPEEPLEVCPGPNFKPTRDILAVLPTTTPPSIRETAERVLHLSGVRSVLR